MNKVVFALIFILLPVSVTGQRVSDYGLLTGVSSYYGDINPSKVVYSPKLAMGLFYRYNPHPRHAYRATLLYGSVSADDRDFANDYQQNRAASFNRSLFELSFQFEFNFFPYTTMGKPWDFSPYFAAGAGVVLLDSYGMELEPVIPFSLGFKVNIHKNIGLEAECGFRKTFYDNFDGLKDDVSPSDFALFHNNDWYSFVGVALTWKIYNKLQDCPAYKDLKSRRRG